MSSNKNLKLVKSDTFELAAYQELIAEEIAIEFTT